LHFSKEVRKFADSKRDARRYIFLRQSFHLLIIYLMKKTLLLLCMFVACMATSWAGDVVFDFTHPTALTPSVTPSEDASSGVDLGDCTFTNEGISLQLVKGTASNPARIWTTTKGTPELRSYKGSTITISAAEAITGIALAGNKISALSATEGTFASGTWTGNATSVTFNVTNTLNITSITVTTGGDTPDPTPAVKEYTLPYTNALTEDNGDFTIDNKQIAEGLNYVWSFDSRYGAKASGYYQKAYDTEAWLVSPVFNLEGLTSATLSFQHAVNKFTGEIPAQAKLLVNEVGTEKYDDIAIPNWGTNADWNFVAGGDIDLSSYAGKKIHVIFKYTSTAEAAGTWEIKDFSLTATKASAVVAPSITPTGSIYTGSVTVTITPAAEDDALYYTLDGTDPVPGQGTTQAYTAPFELTQSATVKAIAENAEGSLSAITEKSYTIIQPTPVPAGHPYTFDFNNETRSYTTTPAEAGWSTNAENEGELGNVTGLTLNGIAITLPEKAEEETAPSIHARLWKATSNFTLRFYNGQKMNIAAPEGKKIAGIVFYGLGSDKIALQAAGSEAALTVEKAETGYKAVFAPKAAAATADFTATATNQLTAIDVILDSEITGIHKATLQSAGNAAVYDLSGRRVQQAKNGLYIVNGQKVLVK